MKKILHICKFFEPDKGGVEYVSKLIADNLSNKYYENDIVCFGKNKKKYEPSKVIRFKSITLLSQPISIKYFFWIINNINKYDEVIVHYPNVLILPIFALPIKIMPRISVYYHADIHGKKLYPLFRFLENNLLNISDKIYATTNSYARYSKPLNKFQDKISISPITIKESKTNFIRDSKTIISIGRLVDYKGYCELITNFSLIDESANLIIIGDGPLRVKIINLVKSLGLSKRVSLLGQVSNEMLNDYLLNSRIHLLSSINKAEAFGVVTIEAMSRGCPTVCFDIKGSGVPEVNLNSDNRLVAQSGCYKSLAKKINKLIVDDKYHQNICLESYKFYKKNFEIFKLEGFVIE